MIVGAAVCPGAPFLVPGLADRLADASADLIAACIAAIRPLARADRIVVMAAGHRGTVVYPPGTVEVMASSFGRSDLTPRRCGPPLGAGSVVGRSLLSRTFAAGDPAPVTLVETGGDPIAAGAAVRHGGPGRYALLVIADGSAAHGDHAPAARDDRSEVFDDMVAAALGAGDPAALRLACADQELNRRLLAVTEPLQALAELTVDDRPADAELLYRGAPFGVGYLVAAWRWTDR